MDDALTAILIAEAERAAHNAYAPYSAFRVGAALRTANGGAYVGCNVENASFPVGGCAERHAIAAAISAEGPETRIAAIAIVALTPVGDAVACAPCGACRQAILEFGPEALVIFRAGEDHIAAVSADGLLPGAFRFGRS
jgi:cytidine deaminase